MPPRRILLLENVAAQAAGVRERLAAAGHQVAVSRYEADGLRRLAEWAPDLVLLSSSHPAGSLVAYCRAARAAAPRALLVVTSAAPRDQLLGEHPGLAALVSGVLVRPFGAEDVEAILARLPAPAADGEPLPAGDVEELQARFQREVEERFLEAEQLRRRLAEALRAGEGGAGPAAGTGEGVAQLRRELEECGRKSALALAMENLRRSELEVKLDNLLRMKDEFEQRAQDEIESRADECERLRGEVEALGARAAAAAGESAGLRRELEGSLVEKERLEERLHRIEAGGDGAPGRPAPEEGAGGAGTPAEQGRAEAAERCARELAERVRELEAEALGLRSRAAEADAAAADLSARNAVLEAGEARDRASASEAERAHAQELALARARCDAAEQRGEELTATLNAGAARAGELEAEVSALREREGRLREEAGAVAARAEAAEGALAAAEERARLAEEARAALAAEAEGAVADLAARAAALEDAFEREREGRARDAARLGEESAAALRAAGEGERERESLRARLAQVEGALAEERETRDRDRGEREGAAGALREELLAWRGRAEAATLEAGILRAQGEERGRREQAERAALAARLEEALAGLARAETARADADAAAAALAGLRAELDGLRERAGAEGEERRRLEAELERALARARSAEAELAARPPAAAADAPALVEELAQLRRVVEEVVTRAREEVVAHAQREVELATRLEGAREARRELEGRLERTLAESADRERRTTSLLQVALDRATAPPPAARDNLPALLPAEPDPVPPPSLPSSPPPRERLVRVAAVALVLAAAGLAVFVARRGGDERRPARVAPAAPASAPVAAAPPGPREVWERWTRSDASGGVMLQATLRTEEELRAEVEADRRARGWSEGEARAELERLLARYRFDRYHYVHVHARSLVPGYPGWLDEPYARFSLRDDRGGEAPAVFPPGHERERAVYSFGAGEGAAAADRTYEATLPLAFERSRLAAAPAFLQLVARDVGATARRALIWELR